MDCCPESGAYVKTGVSGPLQWRRRLNQRQQEHQKLVKTLQMIFIVVSRLVCYHFLKIWRSSVESVLRLVCMYVCVHESVCMG